MWFINTLLGFLIAQIYDIFKRQKTSGSSPYKFSLKFFWLDTRVKLLVSLALAISIALAIHLNWDNALKVFDNDLALNDLIYLLVGAVPELVLAYLKRKVGFLQPEKVGTYDRKK